MILSPLLARRRYSTPFFAFVALAAVVLTMPDTPLHHVFYLLPKFELLHGHYPHRILIIFNLALALLVGAAVSALPRWRGDRVVAKYAAIGVFGFIAVLTLLGIPVNDIPPLAIGSIVIVWLLLTLLAFANVGRASSLIAVLIIGALFIDPTGWTLPDRYPRERGDAQIQRILDGYQSTSGPVAFLREQNVASPMRFTGYELGMSGESRDPAKFYGQYRASRLIAVIVNNRALYLDLYDIQGYNPVQIARYNSYIQEMNGEVQEYHESHLLPGGIGSPLLDLLGVRYIVVTAPVPPGRPDLLHMSQTYPTAYADKWTRILENSDVFPRAWIVHEAVQVAEGEALPLMTSGQIDLRTTAVLETAPPPMAPATNPATDAATITRSEPDAMTLTTATDAPGLLMLSEIYDPGWQAYLNGEEVELYVADHVFRAVPIPAGEHTVELRYEPASLRTGLAISGATALAIGGAWCALGWQSIRNRTGKIERRWRVRRPGSGANA